MSESVLMAAMLAGGVGFIAGLVVGVREYHRLLVRDGKIISKEDIERLRRAVERARL